MCSFAVRNDFLQFAFYLVALVIGGSLEEFAPKLLSVGFPMLLALSVGVAERQSLVTAILFSLAAGAFEDALSSLPAMTSPCFFAVVALIVWRTRFARLALVVAYPVFQVWLKLIVPGLAGSLGTRLLLSVPIALFMAFVLLPALAWVERKAAVDVA